MKSFFPRTKPSVSLFACAACALGLLLWARLLLVSSPPRIATAEPFAPSTTHAGKPTVEHTAAKHDREAAAPVGR